MTLAAMLRDWRQKDWKKEGQQEAITMVQKSRREAQIAVNDNTAGMERT